MVPRPRLRIGNQHFSFFTLMLGVAICSFVSAPGSADQTATTSVKPETQTGPFQLKLRHQVEVEKSSDRFHRLTRQETWEPNETAFIVCDMWDYHHCHRAVLRVGEFAPRLNKVLKNARQRGSLVIHAPSDCMPAYTTHAARQRAIQTPRAVNQPADIKKWCSRIPSEERGVYPIDQSDGGEDDSPEEHAAWSKKLAEMGRNPNLPWQKQTDMISIDSDRDFITDRGDEVWNILQHHGIKNVVLTGVHVNMCVLGRPFGLRQLKRNSMNVVLMRDMTDAMYNPRRWPYVNHFTGNDLVIEHIEKYVCPTITSDQIIGGHEFRFKADSRPHVAIVMAEDEYGMDETLPVFARQQLGKSFRYSFVFGDSKERNNIPGLAVLDEADVAIFAVRRRVLPKPQMDAIRRFEASGKPIIGLRTASHAFSLRKSKPPADLYDWQGFDAEVFGGNYHGHHKNNLVSTVALEATSHPILANIASRDFQQGGSLYETAPLADGSKILMMGAIEGIKPEPVTWTFTRKNGGRSFYTSLGHKDDFANPAFVRMLLNAVCWANDLTPPEKIATASDHWKVIDVPSSLKEDGVVWHRCVVNLPEFWTSSSHVSLNGDSGQNQPKRQPATIWFNGTKLDESGQIPSDVVNVGEANLLVIRTRGGLIRAPIVATDLKRKPNSLDLKGRWQYRVGDEPSWSNMPLPAKFGGPTDIYFEISE